MKKIIYPSREEIIEAEEKIQPYVAKTPVVKVPLEIGGESLEMYCKMECFMPVVHAFKIRGAMNAVLSLSEKERNNGLVTHSSGNHGKALAYAAKVLGIPAYIVVPENAPKIKRKGIEEQGAMILDCAPTQEVRESTAAKVAYETGASFIHPYNDYNVIAGQATAAKEFIEEVPNLDYILAPVGGGGLLSGTSLSSHYFSDSTSVIGAEPEKVNDAYRSLASGVLQKNNTMDTIADGLRMSLGDKTFPIIQKLVNRIIQVMEDEIKVALNNFPHTIEPSSAVPVAAIVKEKEFFHRKKIGVIVTGGNIEQ